MRSLVHIGPAKTGSSYLQTNLVHWRPDLAARGICFPDEWREFDWHNHSVISFLLQSGRDQALREGLARLRDTGIHTLILSCEGFDAMPAAQIATLRAALGDGPAEIIHYARRWSDRLPSLWGQEVRVGWTRPLPDAIERMAAGISQRADLNNALCWQRWAGIFGRDALRIVPFDDLRAAGTDIATHFLTDIVGLPDPPPLAETREKNVSSTPIETETLRLLNTLRADRLGLRDSALHHRLRKRAGTIDLSAWEALLRPWEQTFVVSDSDPRLAEAFAAMGAWTDRVAGLAQNGRVFEPRDRAVVHVGPGYLADGCAMALLHGIYAQLGGDRIGKAPDREERFARQRA